MKGESQLVTTLATNLAQRLGSGYVVLPQSHSSGLVGGNPDITVYNSNTNQVVLVEVKGSGLEFELPLATLPVLRRMRELNKELHPKLILITTSRVGLELRDALLHDNVYVLEAETQKNVVEDVAHIIVGPAK